VVSGRECVSGSECACSETSRIATPARRPRSRLRRIWMVAGMAVEVVVGKAPRKATGESGTGPSQDEQEEITES
jgi:hypothetical protein